MALGNLPLMDELKIDAGELSAKSRSLRANGQTTVFVTVDGHVAGIIAVADPIKATTAEAIRRLHKEGVQIVMVTGDSGTSAQAVAAKLNLDEVVAEVLPDQKVEVVKRFQSQGRSVAMAGDGVNDAPALAQSDVGIAMGTGLTSRLARRMYAGEGRHARHRARAAIESRHDAKRQTESLLGFCL